VSEKTRRNPPGNKTGKEGQRGKIVPSENLGVSREGILGSRKRKGRLPSSDPRFPRGKQSVFFQKEGQCGGPGRANKETQASKKKLHSGKGDRLEIRGATVATSPKHLQDRTGYDEGKVP